MVLIKPVDIGVLHRVLAEAAGEMRIAGTADNEPASIAFHGADSNEMFSAGRPNPLHLAASA